MTQQQMKSLAAQRDQLELVATRLKSCRDFVQESLSTGTRGEILGSKKSVVKQIKDMIDNFKSEPLRLQQKANMQFTHCQKELNRACQQFGKVFSCSALPEKCHTEGKGLHIAAIGETATATVELVDQEGRDCTDSVDITCELVPRDSLSQVRGEVKKVGASKYEISYQSQLSGQHQLHIQVEGTNIARSPFTISAYSTTPTNTIAGVSDPGGVAVNGKGQIVVTSSNEGSVSIFNANGGKVKSFGSSGSGPGQMSNPIGVAFTVTGDILVADRSNPSHSALLS